MIAEKRGYVYKLKNMESDTDQTLKFIEKERVNSESVNLQTVNNGTTNEEVLAMLIDRMQFLNEKFPCRENSMAITKLDEALMWLNRRTSIRTKRGVEGKHVV